MENCIFCQIVSSNLEAYKLYEDDKVIAILDRHPVRDGHTMIIPKTHVEHFIDLSPELAAHIAIIGNKIGQKIQKTLNPLRIGFVVSGFGVPHVHYHIIPMHSENDITSCVYASIENDEILFSMKNTPAATKEKQTSLQELLKESAA